VPLPMGHHRPPSRDASGQVNQLQRAFSISKPISRAARDNPGQWRPHQGHASRRPDRARGLIALKAHVSRPYVEGAIPGPTNRSSHRLGALEPQKPLRVACSQALRCCGEQHQQQRAVGELAWSCRSRGGSWPAQRRTRAGFTNRQCWS